MQDHGTSPERRVSNEQNKVVGGAGLVGENQVPILEKIEQKTVKGCDDLTNGYWVFDESYPLYAKDSCPFIDEGFDCEGNGRLDRNYSKWRWQPKGCDLPRYCQIQSFSTLFFFGLLFPTLQVLGIIHFIFLLKYLETEVKLIFILWGTVFFLGKGSMQQKCWS